MRPVAAASTSVAVRSAALATYCCAEQGVVGDIQTDGLLWAAAVQLAHMATLRS